VGGKSVERLLLAIVALGVGALAIFTLAAWRDYRDAEPRQGAAATPAPVATQPTASVAAAEFTGTTAEAAPTRLVLRAARGDSWLAVRVGSETGASLYEGTLVEGERLSYRRNRLWIRFGLPENVDARIDGEPVPLPAGVMTMLLRRGRLVPAETG
jgi:hypothetical protein